MTQCAWGCSLGRRMSHTKLVEWPVVDSTCRGGRGAGCAHTCCGMCRHYEREHARGPCGVGEVQRLRIGQHHTPKQGAGGLLGSSSCRLIRLVSSLGLPNSKERTQARTLPMLPVLAACLCACGSLHALLQALEINAHFSHHIVCCRHVHFHVLPLRQGLARCSRCWRHTRMPCARAPALTSARSCFQASIHLLRHWQSPI